MILLISTHLHWDLFMCSHGKFEGYLPEGWWLHFLCRVKFGSLPLPTCFPKIFLNGQIHFHLFQSTTLLNWLIATIHYHWVILGHCLIQYSNAIWGSISWFNRVWVLTFLHCLITPDLASIHSLQWKVLDVLMEYQAIL